MAAQYATCATEPLLVLSVPAVMDDILDFMADEDNTMVLVGGATCAAVAIGALLMNSGPSQEERAEAAAESLKEETLSHDPGRAKKKVKKPKPSKPVLPKKKKQVVQEKNRWDNSSSEEEEPMYVEPEPTQKKKGKKGKGAAPVEDEWSTVPKKERKKSKSEATSASDGKVVLDLGDAKPAVIGKKGVVIQDIQVRWPRFACECDSLPGAECPLTHRRCGCRVPRSPPRAPISTWPTGPALSAPSLAHPSRSV